MDAYFRTDCDCAVLHKCDNRFLCQAFKSCFVTAHLDHPHLNFSNSAGVSNVSVPRHLSYVKLSHFLFYSIEKHRRNDSRHEPGSGLCLKLSFAGTGEGNGGGVTTHLSFSKSSSVLIGIEPRHPTQIND